MAPLPFSTRFSPYHAIVLLPAFLVLLSTVIDKKAPSSLRGVALTALVCCEVLVLAVTDWGLRSGMYLVSFSLVLIALGAARYVERDNIPPELHPISN
jgi:hypothetical protein